MHGWDAGSTRRSGWEWSWRWGLATVREGAMPRRTGSESDAVGAVLGWIISWWSIAVRGVLDRTEAEMTRSRDQAAHLYRATSVVLTTCT